jgi:dipeptidyl aminopeptidase/acylaminoacyl peptidase
MRISLVLAMLLVLGAAKAQGPAEATVDVIKGLAYKTGPALTAYERERCVLDLYLPKTRIMPVPVIVWFHGGALEGNSKNDNETVVVARRFARDGVAVAVAEYRISPKVKYPAYIEDAAAAVAWVKTHAAEYGINSKAVFVGGHSAGGYLAGMVGLDPLYLEFWGANASELAGIIPVSGQMFTHFTVRKERGIAHPETTPIIDAAAPAYHIRKETPPILLVMGDHDWPARAEENRYFQAIMKVAGNTRVEYQEFADRDHGTIIGRIPDAEDPVALAILGFVKRNTPVAVAAP